MITIHEAQCQPTPGSEMISPQNPTPAQTRRIVHISLATMFGIGGIFVSSTWIDKIFYLSAATLCAYAAWTQMNYDNPDELREIRAQSVQTPLAQLIQRHGWHNLFQYEILYSGDQWNTALKDHLDTLPFPARGAFWHEANDQITSYYQKSPIPEDEEERYTIPPLNAWIWEDGFQEFLQPRPLPEVTQQIPVNDVIDQPQQEDILEKNPTGEPEAFQAQLEPYIQPSSNHPATVYATASKITTCVQAFLFIATAGLLITGAILTSTGIALASLIPVGISVYLANKGTLA